MLPTENLFVKSTVLLMERHSEIDHVVTDRRRQWNIGLWADCDTEKYVAVAKLWGGHSV
jgi:hypothetical protein